MLTQEEKEKNLLCQMEQYLKLLEFQQKELFDNANYKLQKKKNNKARKEKRNYES